LVRTAERGSVPWIQGMYARLHILSQAGRVDEFLAALAVLQETTFTQETVVKMVNGLVQGTYLLDLAGRIEQANQLGGRITTIVQTMGDREPLASILWYGICALRDASARKDPWGAIKHGKAAMRLAKAIGHPRYLGLAQAYLGMNLWFIGAFDEAEQ